MRHLEGTSIRKLASQLESRKSTIQDSISSTLLKVPNSNHISEFVCKFYCGILIVDAKYINVKAYEKKIAFIYCIDYLSHDILINMLAPSENYQAYLAFFQKLKAINYPLEFLVCDELDSISLACRYFYPKVKVQNCTNHYKEGIRRELKVRTNDEHNPFMSDIENLFNVQSMKDFNGLGNKLYKKYSSNDIYKNLLLDISKKKDVLTTYLQFKRCPATSNLIELFNSHLEARLRPLKGFNSFQTAELWLNAYVMNRRLSKFTDCSKKFKHLNGKCSLSITAGYDVPKVSLLKKPS